MTTPLGQLLSGLRSPLEMQYHICSFLDPKDLATAELVCKGIQPGLKMAREDLQKTNKYYIEENKSFTKNYKNHVISLFCLIGRETEVPKDILAIFKLSEEDVKALQSQQKTKAEINEILNKIPILSIKEVQRIQEFFRTRGLLGPIKQYPQEQIPQEIAKLYKSAESRALTKEEEKLIQNYKQARDTLASWNRFTTANLFRGLNDVNAYIQRAKRVTSWIKKQNSPFKKREAIELKNLSLTFFPEGLEEFKKLKKLDLTNNSLSSFPEALTELNDLEHLELKGNHFETLPHTLGQLTNLSRLSLCRNRLQFHQGAMKELGKTLGRITSLQDLDLSLNFLRVLPPSWESLKTLKSLSLSCNHITSIPKPVEKMTNLKKLVLFGNRLKSIPKGIVKLEKLEEFDLRGNQFTSIPKELSEVTTLNTLRLDDNKLTSIPQEVTRMPSLSTLSVQNNPLESIPTLEHGGRVISNAPEESSNASSSGCVA